MTMYKAYLKTENEPAAIMNIDATDYQLALIKLTDLVKKYYTEKGVILTVCELYTVSDIKILDIPELYKRCDDPEYDKLMSEQETNKSEVGTPKTRKYPGAKGQENVTW